MKAVPLLDFCKIVQGGRHRHTGNDFVETGFPAYGAGGLNGRLPDFEFDREAVILSAIGARCGKCFYVAGKWSSLANVQVILPDPKAADAKFLWYQLNDESRWPRSGTGQPFIKPSDVQQHIVYLPPIDEQRRIAAILDQADYLRRKRRLAHEKLNTLPQAIFQEMFSSTASSRFPFVSIGTKLDFLTSGSRGWAKHYAPSGSLFLRIQNVRRDELDLSDVAYVQPPSNAEAKRTRVRAGDVLLSITADLGRTAVVAENIGEAYINQHLAILRTSQLTPRFLSAALSTPASQAIIAQKNRGGVKAGLNFDDVRTLQIPDVPIELQREFAIRVSACDAIRDRHRAHLAELDTLFASLQHRAFAGELLSTIPATAVAV